MDEIDELVRVGAQNHDGSSVFSAWPTHRALVNDRALLRMDNVSTTSANADGMRR